jgi:hypothetical protein
MRPTCPTSPHSRRDDAGSLEAVTTKNVGELVQADIGKTVTYQGAPGNSNSGKLNQANHASFGTTIVLDNINITVMSEDQNQSVDVEDAPSAQ